MKKTLLVLTILASSLSAMAFTDAEVAEIRQSACKDMTEQVEMEAEMLFEQQTGIAYKDVADIEIRLDREANEDKFQTILDQVVARPEISAALNKACQ